MAALPRTTDVADAAASVRADAFDARRARHGRLHRALHAEPWWLHGVTSRLVAMVVTLAVLENLPQVFRVVLPGHRGDVPSWQFALFDLADQLLVGVTIMLVAAVLLNLPRPRIPIRSRCSSPSPSAASFPSW